MSVSSRRLDRFAATFDHEGLVANAGLILVGTLMARLGLLRLIERCDSPWDVPIDVKCGL